MKGTKFGPMVIAGQPDTSNLVVLVEGKAKIQMPYGHKPLPECLRRNIWSWIFEGAKTTERGHQRCVEVKSIATNICRRGTIFRLMGNDDEVRASQ